VAHQFVDTVVKLHSMPLTIVSDRDRIFTSAFWKLLFQKLGTKLNYSTAYHQCLEMFLRCMVQDLPKQWRRILPLAEFWYNSTFHSSLGRSPFKTLYDHEPNFGAMPDLENGNPPVTMHVQKTLLTNNLNAAQARMKHNADKHCVERQFQVGEKVLLKLQPYAQASVVNRPYPKPAYKYFGPYSILERINKAAYRLELPVNS
jgi:hypothetical protein